MKECKDCELAVFCYSDPDSWTFRTKEEMRETAEKMAACDRFQALRRSMQTKPAKGQRSATAAGS